jgi:acyl-coenzyme A synthetase/AMP-(fatty) acid ligase
VVTYRDLDELTSQFGHLLGRLGVTRGDVISLMLPNIPEFIYAYFGAMRVGVAAGPINTALEGPEMAYILNNSEAKVLVTEQKYLDEVLRVKDDLKHLKHILMVGTRAPKAPWTSTEELYKESTARPVVDVAPDDLSEIIYTSGTTAIRRASC